MDYIVTRVSEDELYHFGVKGMKWGVIRKRDKGTPSRRDKKKQEIIVKERKSLIDDSKNVTAKASPGKHLMVPGKYNLERSGKAYLSYHVVNDKGKVKMSYIQGTNGPIVVASSKNYVERNIDMNEYFKRIPNDIEYDVYK